MSGKRAEHTHSEFTDQGEPVPLDELLFSSRSTAQPFDDGERDDPLCSSEDEPDLAPGLVADPAEFDPSLDEPYPVVKRPAKRGRPKGSTNQPSTEPPPPTVDASGTPLSVYQRLEAYGLLRKVTDIVLAKVAIPWHLRADAAQEVHATWAMLTAKPEYQRNQLAHYAYKSGQHAALKLRRTIGAVVVIPGALFRTGRDTAFMEAIGAAVNPRDVDDYKDSLDLAVEPIEDLNRVLVSDALFESRLSNLNLSAKQLRVARMALVERKAADDIARELGTQLIYIERMLNQVTKKLMEQDGVQAAKALATSAGARLAEEPRDKAEELLDEVLDDRDPLAAAPQKARSVRANQRDTAKAKSKSERKGRKAREAL